MSRSHRIRGHEEVEILEYLADGQMGYRAIGEIFDRSEQGIKNFAADNRDRIEQLKVNHAQAISGIWIAKKELRLAEMKDKYDTLDEILGQMEDEDAIQGGKPLDVGLVLKITAELRALLKQAAEEQGELPTRAPNTGPPPEGVRWVIERDERKRSDGA